jgi:hypothetical protein
LHFGRNLLPGRPPGFSRDVSRQADAKRGQGGSADDRKNENALKS